MSSAPSANKIVFDVETQHTFDEVGGANERHKLGVSFVGIYSYAQDKFFGFFEKDLAALEKILFHEKPMLIGFNSLHFDIPVLQPYFKKINLAMLPQLDILKEIYGVLGHRVKLDNVALATLYEGKSGSGLDAIRWYREGNLEALSKYCIDDVRVTRDIYDYGARHGRIYYPTAGQKRAIPIEWVQNPTIGQQLSEAFKKHEQIEMEYWELDDKNQKKEVKRKVEILDFDGEWFDAFCHRANAKLRFSVANVWKIYSTGQTFAHQERLF